jgi:RNA-directed DNA polymerase
MDTVILEKWLRCGFTENANWFATEAGTPQGGIVSPTLANLTLDGLEVLLMKMFPRRQEKGRWVHPKVHLVRYADDFIITGSSHSLLVNEVQPLVEEFLRERGLNLSVEKTRVTRIQDGFDFLGQHLRKYGGKLLVTPSKKNSQALLTKVRGVIEKNKSATQGNMIAQLNPIIRGWANYHCHCVASRAFDRMDFEIWRKLWRWSRRKHPTKNAGWVKARYFHAIGGRTWTSLPGSGWFMRVIRPYDAIARSEERPTPSIPDGTRTLRNGPSASGSIMHCTVVHDRLSPSEGLSTA